MRTHQSAALPPGCRSAVLARRSCAFPNFQPARNDLLDDTSVSVLCCLYQQATRVFCHFGQRLRDRGQCRVDLPRQRDVIKTGDRDVVGNLQPNFSALRMTPTAISSLAAKIAVGGAFRAKNFHHRSRLSRWSYRLSSPEPRKISVRNS